MTSLLLAVAAGTGVHLLWTGGRAAAPMARTTRRPIPVELVVVLAVSGLLGIAVGWTLFGSPLPALGCGAAGVLLPWGSARRRRVERREAARDHWPQLLEEVRLGVTSLGRSIPQALFAAGRHAPDDMRRAFADAERVWSLSTDLAAALTVLRDRVDDPTADTIAETLLVAHEVGGVDIGTRLSHLAADRARDLANRRDARAQQAGARFARQAVLAVPLGMALVGLSIGRGREAYATATGQLAVLVALVLLAGCWVWSGTLLRLPDEPRVWTAPTSRTGRSQIVERAA